MIVATFVIPSGPHEPEELVVYECKECAKEVLATESDKHAARKHKAASIRVFSSPGAYQDFINAEKIRASITEGA